MKRIFSKLLLLLIAIVALPTTVLAETTYDVTITAKYDSNNLSYADIYIYNSENEIVESGTTNKNGRYTISLPNGTYKAVIDYNNGSYTYSGTQEFTVNNNKTSATVNVTREYNVSAAEDTYNATTNFNHVDVKVNGTFTEIKGDSVVKHDIKLQNVTLLVKSSSASDAKTIVNKTYTDNSETYEWRAEHIEVPKTAIVTITMDLYLGTTLMREDYVITYQGKEDFIQAILDCDHKQGLDFRIDPQEIIEEIFYEVSYEWVLEETKDGVTTTTSLPSTLGIHTPTKTGDYEPTEKHTIDTHWKPGVLAEDQETGIVYEFLGWSEYKYASDTERNDITSSTTEIATTDDVTIYGVWVVHSYPEPEYGYITIYKNFFGNYNGAVPENLHFLVVDKNTDTEYDIEIQYTQFIDGKYELKIYTTGTYHIEEHSYELGGHTFLSDQSTATTQEIVVTDLEAENKVVFNNYYEKNVGATINESILTIRKEDGETHSVLSGAKFELVNNETGNKVHSTSTETNESGYISFVGMATGVYTLTETQAPANYYLDETKYTVIVTEKSRHEYLDEASNTFITVIYHNVDVTPGERYNGENLRLTVHNDKMYGSITINKEFASSSDINEENLPSDVEIKVTVTGDNYNETFTLNESNNYSVTIDNLELGTYTITEESADIDDYELTTTYTKESITLSSTNLTDTTTITNNYEEIITYIDVTVTKVWDKNGSKVELPESIEVGLYKDGTLYETVTLTSESNWSYVFEDLDDKYTWTVDELSELENFEKTIDIEENEYVITNTYKTEYINLLVKKEWNLNGKEIELPESVQMILYRDDVEFARFDVYAEANWKFVFPNFDTSYTYTVKEVTELEDFTSSVERNGNTFTVTNTYNPQTIELTIKKVWDSSDYEIVLPESIDVTIYQDGEEYQVITLNSLNNWTYTIEVEDGYVWTVDETEIPEDYVKTINVEGNVYTITNTFTPETGEGGETPKDDEGDETPKDDEGDETPKDDENNNEENNDGNEVPKTGDEDEVVVYLIGLIASVSLLIGNVLSFRKRLN